MRVEPRVSPVTRLLSPAPRVQATLPLWVFIAACHCEAWRRFGGRGFYVTSRGRAVRIWGSEEALAPHRAGGGVEEGLQLRDGALTPQLTSPPAVVLQAWLC